jgi:preprotein translocase subunit SecF
MINIIGHRKIFYAISGLFVAASIFGLTAFGLKTGIDFKGGSIQEIEFKGNLPPTEEIRKSLVSLNLGDFSVRTIGVSSMILKFKELDEPTHRQILETLQKGFEGVEEKRFESIGPSIGRELRNKAITSSIIVLLAISFYIAWAFRKISRPVSSWRYGVATLIALFHDILIPTGVFAYLGHYRGVEIDSNFIVAILVILGFSVHDTIVVFDRTRENLKRYSWVDFGELVNQSVNEIMTRSINTSLTVLLVLAALLFLGGVTTKYFVLALMLGIFFGTYSSIFIASALIVDWERRLRK